MRHGAIAIGVSVLATLTACAGSSSPISAPPQPAATATATAASPARPTATPVPGVAREAARQRAQARARLRAARHRAAERAAATRASEAALAAAPRFSWHSRSVTATSLGKSWHPGCPVGPRELRALSMTFWGFDGSAHNGTLIVRSRAVPAYVAAFRAMYHGRFPIRRMRPVSDYGGSDNRSMRHDNTSAFNCRYAVSNGPKHWSMHAYGEAVDINTVENPYYLDGRVRPKRGAPYMDRSNVRPGMIVSGSLPVRAFAAQGWGWGGSWSSSPDYQHFSSTGG